MSDEVDALKIARFMYERNVSDYTDDTAHIEIIWQDPDVRSFWVAEAEAVLGFLGFARGA